MLGAWPFLRYTILGQLFRHNSAYYTVSFRSNKGGRNSIKRLQGERVTLKVL